MKDIGEDVEERPCADLIFMLHLEDDRNKQTKIQKTGPQVKCHTIPKTLRWKIILPSLKREGLCDSKEIILPWRGQTMKISSFFKLTFHTRKTKLIYNEMN